MHRFTSATRTAALVVLLGLLLAACRVPNVPITASPSTTSYPGPAAQRPTAAAPVQQTTVPLPPPSPVPTAASTSGESAFTVTILHTGAVAGEVLPCG